MSLDLSPDVEQVIRQRADAEGVSVNDLLARTFIASEKKNGDTPMDPQKRVLSLVAKWQADDNTPSLQPISTREGETSTDALFRKWEEEDTAMTDEEVASEEQLWKEFQSSINETRRAQGMREL